MILHYSRSLGHDGVEVEPTEHDDIESLVLWLVENGETLGTAVSASNQAMDVTAKVSRVLEAEREHLNNYRPLQGRPPV